MHHEVEAMTVYINLKLKMCSQIASNGWAKNIHSGLHHHVRGYYVNGGRCLVGPNPTQKLVLAQRVTHLLCILSSF